MSVVIETTMGDITVDLYIEQRPRTCLNFLKLCKIKYYNFCLLHSIQRNFMVQTGDPLGTGRGGESVFCKLYGDQAKYFEAEALPKLKHTKIGTLSMVNNGQNAHGSQFFITTGENLDYLDGVHTVFGEVTEGFDVLMKINDAICDEQHRPYKDIRITHTVILDDPFDDPKGLDIPDRSPELTEEHLRTERIGVDEDIDDTTGKTLEEIEEEIKDKEAKARATILEMVGDLPDVDVKPPENVLFVCKLNPVTTDDDLEIIFSRFGPIVSCEVIRDKKSGESLQYAFIEFEKEEDCENAYFKMDNVLIDDRRIHVDFSQSVSKLRYQPKDGKLPTPNVKDNNNDQKNKFLLKEKGRPQGNYEMVFDSPVVPRIKETSDRHMKKREPDSDDNDSSGVNEKKHSKHHGWHKSSQRTHDRDSHTFSSSRSDHKTQHHRHSHSSERYSSRSYASSSSDRFRDSKKYIQDDRRVSERRYNDRYRRDYDRRESHKRTDDRERRRDDRH